MAHIPTEQEDVDAYPGIIEGTARALTSFGNMLTLSDEEFNKFFISLGDEKLLALAGMRGRYERRQAAAQQVSGGGEQPQEFGQLVQNVELLVRIAINDKVLRQTDIFYVEGVTDRSQDSQTNFKKTLARLYSPKDQEYYSHLICMVTGEKLLYSKCIAGHIVPYAARQRLVEFGLNCTNINDVNNGILWAQGIENVFHPAGQVCIFHDFIHNKFVFKVLDKRLLSKIIEPTNLTFAKVDGRPLRFPGNHFPKKRFLLCHARAAILRAHEKKWIDLETDIGWKDYLSNIDEFMDFISKEPQSDSNEAIQRMLQDRNQGGASEEIVESTVSNEEIVGTKGSRKLVLCSQCKEEKDKFDFTKNQMSRKKQRRCRKCISNSIC